MTEPAADPDAEDRRWLLRAIEVSASCEPSPTAFSVGAVVVADGRLLASGFSRESEPTAHAEESALAKLASDDPRLRRATVYSSLEPCGRRRSRPRTCARLIIDAGIRRVVYALGEPPVFVVATGVGLLRAAGVEVVEIAELADRVRAVNGHLGLE